MFCKKCGRSLASWESETYEGLCIDCYEYPQRNALNECPKNDPNYINLNINK